MPERYEEDASRAITLSKAEARRFGHRFVGTEHLLLALTDGTDTEAARILEQLGVSAAAVNVQIQDMVATKKPSKDRELHLTPRARIALYVAALSARRLRTDTVRTGHLLYGLAAEADGLAAQVLLRHGVTKVGIDRFLAIPVVKAANIAGGDPRKSEDLTSSRGLSDE